MIAFCAEIDNPFSRPSYKMIKIVCTSFFRGMIGVDAFLVKNNSLVGVSFNVGLKSTQIDVSLLGYQLGLDIYHLRG